MKVSFTTKPFIFVTPLAMAKMQFLVQNVSQEVGWLGSVHTFNPLQHRIDDIYLFEQRVHSAETELDPAALAKFYNEHIELANVIRFWGHSHVNMGVGPSGTDLSTLRDLARDSDGFFLGVIMNKKNDINFSMISGGMHFQEMEWGYAYPREFEHTLEQEIKDKVKEAGQYDYKGQGGAWQHHGGGYRYPGDRSEYTPGQIPGAYGVHGRDWGKSDGGVAIPPGSGHTPPSGSVQPIPAPGPGGHNRGGSDGKQGSLGFDQTGDGGYTDMG